MATHVYLPRSQLNDTGWCGPTCLANAIAIYGIPTSIEEAAGACKTPDTETGANVRNISLGMKHYGFKANIKLVSKKSLVSDAFNWMASKLTAGQIVMVSVNGNYANGHWILVLNVTRAGVHVWDPNDESSKVISRKNLLAAWWNQNSPNDPEREQYHQGLELIAMSPRSKLAKRAVEIRTNLLAPPFGFLPTDKGIPESFKGTE